MTDEGDHPGEPVFSAFLHHGLDGVQLLPSQEQHVHQVFGRERAPVLIRRVRHDAREDLVIPGFRPLFGRSELDFSDELRQRGVDFAQREDAPVRKFNGREGIAERNEFARFHQASRAVRYVTRSVSSSISR